MQRQLRRAASALLLGAFAMVLLLTVPTGSALQWDDSTTGGYGYVAVDQVPGGGFYSWTGGGAPLTVATFGGYAMRAFPNDFEFTFYDQFVTDADMAYMGEDGLLGMDTAWTGRADAALDGPYVMPSGTDPDAFIAPFWFPQYYTCGPGSVLVNGQGLQPAGVANTGAANNALGDRFAFYSWDGWTTTSGPNAGCTDANSYQIRLYNATDIIELHYRAVDTFVDADQFCFRHVVGIEDKAGSNALIVSEDLDLDCVPRFNQAEYAVRLWQNNGTDAWDASYVVDQDSFDNPLRLPTSDDPLYYPGFTDPEEGGLASKPLAQTRYHVQTVDYSPDPGYHGNDSFSFQVDDGYDAVQDGVVTIHVNAPPEASDDTFVVDQDASAASLDVLANDKDAFWSETSGVTTDPELRIKEVDPPANGTLSIAADDKTLLYTAEPGYFGTVTFTYTATDGRLTSEATVTMHVNARPSAALTKAIVAGAGPHAILLNGTDAFWSNESGAAAPADVTAEAGPTAPALGAASYTVGPTLHYTPNAGIFGTDTFQVTYSDGRLSRIGNVEVHVNAPPQANPDVVVVDMDHSVLADLLGNDQDAFLSMAALTGVEAGDHGTTTVVDGQVRYTPDPGYYGPDSFTYTMTDGFGSDATGTVDVHVNALPIAVDDQAGAAVGQVDVPMDVLANDIDAFGAHWGEAPTAAADLRVVSVTPGGGTVKLVGGQVLYTPRAGTLADTFTYTVSDGRVSASAVVAVTVSSDLELTLEPLPVDEGGTATISPIHLEARSDATAPADWSYKLLEMPAHGRLLVSGKPGVAFTQADIDAGRLSYQHDGSEGPTDGMKFRLTNATASYDLLFSIEVASLNDPPHLAHNVLSVPPGMEVPLTAQRLGIVDTDSPSADLQFMFLEAPQSLQVLRSGAVALSFGYDEILSGGLVLAGVTPGIETVQVQTSDGLSATIEDLHVWVVDSNTPPHNIASGVMPLRWGQTSRLDAGMFDWKDDYDGPAGIVLTLQVAPQHGQILVDGIPIEAGSGFTQMDVHQGRITYRHHGTGQDLDRAVFEVRDTIPVYPGVQATLGTLDISITMPPPPPPPEFVPPPQASYIPARPEPSVADRQEDTYTPGTAFFTEASSGPMSRDIDEDGRVNERDNCPSVHNVGQADLDGDGLGDACDLDVDGDGIADAEGDNCPRTANAEQPDVDRDGLGDACDSTIDAGGLRSCSDCAPRRPAPLQESPIDDAPRGVGWPVYASAAALMVVLAALALVMQRLLGSRNLPPKLK